MNAEEFKQQFLPYAQKLYNIAFRLLGSKDEASDAVQDTFLKLWDKRNELKMQKAEAFCITLLKNDCLDILRKHKNSNSLIQETKNDDNYSLEQKIEWHDNWILMKQLIEKLPQQQQQILKMRHINGFEFSEIALHTGLSEQNIRTILSRARKTLHDEFEKINK